MRIHVSQRVRSCQCYRSREHATFGNLPAAGRSHTVCLGGDRPKAHRTRMTVEGVRRDKAALSSGCKAHPARSLQPEATGAGMEVTKCLKPSDSGHELVTARVCRPQRE